MSDPADTPARLPDRPSAENLRKQAKRLARTEELRLAAAQHRIARLYGFADWAALMRAIRERTRPARSPLADAAARGDVETVRALLGQGARADGATGEADSPLYLACDADAPAASRIEIARLLIDAGAFARRGCTGGATPLHAAARRGPAALVELLLRSGAFTWQPDSSDRRPYDEARDGAPEDRERILFMLADGPKILDPDFARAVHAIQVGDEAGLAALLDAHPHLLREPAIEPDFGARGYFSDPMLFWFVANNPTLVPQSPPNIVAITRLMMDRGVAQGDLDQALGLVATNAQMPVATQLAMVEALTEGGARLGHDGELMALGHKQTAPIAWLAERGTPLSAAAAAALGRMDQLRDLLSSASRTETDEALAMAVINRQPDAVRLCLEAGAEPNAFMPCHSHSTPLHQAALDGDVAIIRLLLAHGARPDIEDRLWHGTALGWAHHAGQKEAIAVLRGLSAPS